jgi:hypothetical protein
MSVVPEDRIQPETRDGCRRAKQKAAPVRLFETLVVLSLLSNHALLGPMSKAAGF